MNEFERKTIFGVVNVLMKLLDLAGAEPAPFAGATTTQAETPQTKLLQEEQRDKEEIKKATSLSKTNNQENTKLLKISDFKRRKRKNKNSIEARCTFYGKNISISAKTNTELTLKLRAYIKDFNARHKNALLTPVLPSQPAAVPPQPIEEPKPKTIFLPYALQYLKDMKEGEVTDSWYAHQKRKMEIHIFPLLGEKAIDEIAVFDCQKVLKSVREKGLGRTSEDIHNLLNQIFDCAEVDGLIKRNPMKKIKFHRHERKRGRCLSMEEEYTLLQRAKDTRYFRNVILMLYAGLRGCECDSAKVSEDGRFIIANNAKRKNKKTELKYIPITPMMRPYLPYITMEYEPVKITSMRMWFLKLNMNISAHFCRHTFNTRLTKFKIVKEFRELAMGHKSADVNVDTYTHYEEIKDTFYAEFQRVDYVNELNAVPTKSPN